MAAGRWTGAWDRTASLEETGAGAPAGFAASSRIPRYIMMMHILLMVSPGLTGSLWEETR